MTIESKYLKEYESGMKREDKSEKIDYTLAIDGPMFARYANHLTKGAKVHGKRNWMKATGQQELEDFKAGAMRHMFQWLRGDRDEDHAAAIIFNVNGAEYVRNKLCAIDPRELEGQEVGSQSAPASSGDPLDRAESLKKLLKGQGF